MAAGDAVRTGVELNDVSVVRTDSGADARQPPKPQRRLEPWAVSVLIHVAAVAALMFLSDTGDAPRVFAIAQPVVLLTPYLSPPTLRATTPPKPKPLLRRFAQGPRPVVPKVPAGRKFLPPPKTRDAEATEIPAPEVPVAGLNAANPPVPLTAPNLSIAPPLSTAPPPALKTDNLEALTAVPSGPARARPNADVSIAGFGTREAAPGFSHAVAQVAPAGFEAAAAGSGQRLSHIAGAVGGFEAAASDSAQAAARRATSRNTPGNLANNRGRQSSFGDTAIATRGAPVKINTEATDTAGVEILFKPRPVYTAEARKAAVEGEVLIEMMFTAAGDARVVRIVRGLGHGLDETAVEAARAIRFRPATRAGRAVDSAAVLHISFQLAY